MKKNQDLKLVFINTVGKDWEGLTIYEFIFSKNIEDIDGTDWDMLPASGLPKPPSKDFISGVITIKTDVVIETVQNSSLFSMWDSIDGVIALGWENIDEYETYPENRLVFKFGDSIVDVEEKLFMRDLMDNYKFVSFEEKE
jgi:hypothetical protein